MSILHTILDVGAVAACGLLVLETCRLGMERKNLQRARRWYDAQNESSSNLTRTLYSVGGEVSDEGQARFGDGRDREMCGGCGAFLSTEEIANCAGEKCENFLRPLKLSA